MENTTACINCESATVGTFCHQCGQKQGVARLTWTTLFSELQRRVFGFDNNFIRTAKDLTLRPNRVIETVIEGNRIRYVGPIGYYFIMITIYILLLSLLGVDMSDMMDTMNSAMNPNERKAAFQDQFNQYFMDNFRLAAFLMMPFFILGVWLIFKNKGYNFLETSVITFYGQAHPVWASIILAMIYKITGDTTSFFVMSTITYGYLLIIITVFYKGNKLWNFIKAIFSLILGFIFLLFFVVIVTIIFLVLNPEIAKEMAGK
jgi:hypothetical protein